MFTRSGTTSRPTRRQIDAEKLARVLKGVERVIRDAAK
jgi:hypothetical protein